MTSRSIFFGAALGLFLSLSGCHSSGSGLCAESTWCDGDVLMRCEDRCKQNFDCQREVSVIGDCAVAKSKLGVAGTCGKLSADNGGDFEACVDVPAEPCDRAALKSNLACSPVPGNKRVCRLSPSGYVWDTQPFCTAGQLCHPTGEGIFCYTPPATPCTPGTAPSCSGKTLARCEGTPEAGYILSYFDCPTNCGVDGTWYTRCIL